MLRFMVPTRVKTLNFFLSMKQRHSFASTAWDLTAKETLAHTTRMEPAEYDGVWKEAAEKFLRPLLERCFPEVAFCRELREYEQKKRMPYITSIERIGLERGLERGLEKGLEKGVEKGRQAALQENIMEILEARFGVVPYPWRERLQTRNDESELKRLLRHAAVTPDLDDFQTHFLPPGRAPKRPVAKPAPRRGAK